MRLPLIDKLSPCALNFLECADNHTTLGLSDEEALEYLGKVTDQEALRAAIVEYFGPRCVEDWSSYLRSEKDGICGCCEAWLAFDRFTRSVVYPAAIIDGL